MEDTEERKDDDAGILKDFPIDVKRDIVDILNDTPSLVRLGDKEYRVKNMRYYSLMRIARLACTMAEKSRDVDTDQKVLMALCTDFDAMAEVMAVIMCNHLLKPDDVRDYEDVETTMSRNDRWVAVMKAKVMQSTYEPNQWAAIVLGAIKSIDLSAFFLLMESVSTLTDSMLRRKTRSAETASRFMEALSLQTQATS